MQLTVDIDDDKRSECDPWHGGQSSAYKINYIFNLFCTLFVIILQAVLLWHSLQKFEYKPIHRGKATDKFHHFMGAGSKRSQREIRNEIPCGDGGELTVGMFVFLFQLMVWARFIFWQWNNFFSLPFFLNEFFFFPYQCMVLLFCYSSSSSLVSFTLIPYGPHISWQPVPKEPNQGPTRQLHTTFNIVFRSIEINPCYLISKLVLKKIIPLWTIQKLLIWAKVKKLLKKPTILQEIK